MKPMPLASPIVLLASLVAVTLSVVGCQGGGNGGGSSSITGVPLVRIAGDWSDSTCTFTAVSGSSCVSRLLRSLRNIPFEATLRVEQSGNNITHFVVELSGDIVGPWSGTIDESGNVMLEIPRQLLGGPDASEELVCPDTLEIFTLTLTRSVMTGVATDFELTLSLREDYTLSQGGVELQIVVEKRIEGAR